MFCMSFVLISWNSQTLDGMIITGSRYQDLHILTCCIAICEHMTVFVLGLWLSMQIGTGKEYRPDLPPIVTSDITRFSAVFPARQEKA